MVSRNLFPSGLFCTAVALFFLFTALIAVSFAPGANAAEGNNGAVTILAAGDLGHCENSPYKKLLSWWRGENRYFGGHRTARLLEHHSGTILVLGDLVYRYGRQLDVRKCFEPTWGRFRDRIAPIPGNHDLESANGGKGGWGYYDFWGARAGEGARGYYSFARGTWHMVALNSELDPPGLRAQEAWLRADLAATGARCILAFWHRPMFSSGHHGRSEIMAGAYRLLHEAGASVVLTSHDHDYERFAPLAPDGSIDPVAGIRSFVVGTGGEKLDKEHTPHPHPGSEVFNNTSWGVLKMVLLDGAYTWRFLPVDGHTFTDRGRGRCNERRGRHLKQAEKAAHE